MLQDVKTTRSLRYVEAAETLFQTVVRRRELEKQESELKNVFKAVMPEGGTLRAGAYQIAVTRKVKTTLDREKLVALLGVDAVKELERKTPYLEVTVVESANPPLH